jgi:hypothetical protein
VSGLSCALLSPRTQRNALNTLGDQRHLDLPDQQNGTKVVAVTTPLFPDPELRFLGSTGF